MAFALGAPVPDFTSDEPVRRSRRRDNALVRAVNGVESGVAALEWLCADAWPAVVEEPVGEWRLRAADGFTGRANSVLAVGDPALPVPDALDRARDFARAHGIRPLAQLVTGSAVEDALTAAGWEQDTRHTAGTSVLVLTGPVEGLDAGSGDVAVTVSGSVPDGWWPLVVGADQPTDAQRHVLTGAPRVGYGTSVDDGRVVGVVRGAVLGDTLHIARLAVADTHRRRGLATALLAELAAWAAPATTCVLQVATHNDVALALYEGLGCTVHHGYRYWSPAG